MRILLHRMDEKFPHEQVILSAKAIFLKKDRSGRKLRSERSFQDIWCECVLA